MNTTSEPDSSTAGRHLVLYDGVCGLCNGFVRFVLRRDTAARFVFAPLQSELASRTLAPHGISTEVLSSIRERTAKRQREVGYTGDFQAWIEKTTAS